MNCWRKLKREGGFVIEGEDKQKLQAVLWEDGHLNPKIVAQHALTITGKAGIDLPEGKQFLIVPETGAGPDYPFSGEKLTVTMALYKVKDIDEAIELTNRIQAYQGQGTAVASIPTTKTISEAGDGYPDLTRHGQPAPGGVQQR